LKYFVYVFLNLCNCFSFADQSLWHLFGDQG
jgi:hypothetical protein